MKIFATIFALGIFCLFPVVVGSSILRVEGYTPQVVLQLDHIQPNGQWVVVPKGLVVFTVEPNIQAAPLNPGDYMVCHMKDVRVVDSSGNHKALGFKCGEVTYTLQAIDIQQPKGE